MQSENGQVYLTIHDGIGEIVFNRPEKRNAMNLEMWRDLSQLVAMCATDAAVSVVLVRSADPSVFCAGGDISEFQTLRKDAVTNLAYNRTVKDAVLGLKNLAKPSLAMVSGLCIGGGTEIAVACDLRFCADHTRMGIPPATLGFVYDVAETKMLSDLVGPSRAKDLLFSGRLLHAAEAYQMGLVDRVFADRLLLTETLNYIRLLLNNAQNSIQGCKGIVDALNAGARVDDPRLKQIVDDALDSPQYQEGVRAFLEKRRPNFKKFR
ncbi:hypothetical protein D2Q93_03535 [Alicyclobacillaceae bacterium I2511]|nr:hypothetical protein D2Q93_03535 [Alicyclobacillaceae bacterium I2511]